MAYALSVAQITTVKEVIHPELVAKAYLLTDSMFEDLGVKVTTDVENIDICYLFNRKGLQARPYVVGKVKDSELGKFVDNPAKVEKIYLHTSDSIERYTEKGPFEVTNVAESAEHTTFLLNELSGRFAEDVRANFFYGNLANRKLEESQENAVKNGLCLFDGVYTIIAKRRTDGTISVANGNLIPTGDITGLEADQVYELLTNFYGQLSAALKKPEQTLFIYASDEFCRKAVKGYMLTYPQIAPTTLQAGWKFAEMPNVVLKTSSAMGKGGQLIATIEGNIEFLCDNRENQALISIGQVNKDLRVFDFQANGRATVRIRDFSPEVFAVNDAVNTHSQLPVGDYIANIFTATSANEKMGTVAITSGQKDLYDEGDVITVKATPKEGYAFIGWSPALPGTIPAENRTFTAQWKPNTYYVMFSENGGSGLMGDMDCVYDVPVKLPSSRYTREGYVFDGWNTEEDGSGTAYTDGQEVSRLASLNGVTVRLFAQWRPITYTVHFEPGIPVNGEMADQILAYDQAANLTANAFSTTIGEFVCWNTDPDGWGTRYDDEVEVRNLTAVDGDTVILYAQWHLSHGIRYDQNVFSCAVNGNERAKFWAYEDDTVTVSIVDHSREYTVSVVSASGSDLDFDADAMTFTMPNEAVFITYESLNKMAYTTIYLDDFESWDDVAYLYDPEQPAVTPAVVVKDGETVLTEGTDYTLSITGNTGSASRAVTATVTVTGMGGYIGVNEKTFRITPFNIANCEVRGDLEIIDDGYGGVYPLMEKVQVWNGNVQLKGETLNDSSNVDFTVEIDYPESYYETYQLVPGEYDAHVMGRGDWTGKKAFTFKVIEPRHIVVFVANGGTGTMENDIVTKTNNYVGFTYTLPACGFTAPEGMTFDHWIADCEPEAEKQPGNYFTAPYIWSEYDVQTVTVTAYWRELPRQAVNISDTAHGTVTADAQTAWAGKAVTLDIQPEAGYALDSLTVFAGMDAVTVTDNAFTMPDGAVQVTATFAPVDYSVTVTDNLGGVLTASAATAHVGDTVTLSLPNASYVLEALTVMQGNTPVAVADNRFTMPAGNVQVNAVLRQRFEIVEQWSDMSHSEIWLISGYVGDDTYYATVGDTVTFRVMPEPGYDTVSSVRGIGVEERSVALADLGGNLYSFVMPDFDVFLYAECSRIPVVIPTGHGRVTVDPANPEAGDTVTLTLLPDAGYMAVPQEPYGWPVSIRTAYGEELWPQLFWDEETMKPVFNKYTFDMPSSGVTVTAAFEEAVYGISIVYSVDSGFYPLDEGGMDGTVNGETIGYPYPAKPGDAVALAVTPAPGYELVGITGNYLDYTGASQPVAITRDAANPLVWRFTMPDGWTHLEAAFRKLSLPAFGDPDFTMPAALKTIEESAFEGMPLLHVVDAGSVTAIGQGAFKDSGLQQIRLPKDCAIDADAFAGCGTVYVFAPAGGTTEAFCAGHDGVTFVDVPLTSTTEGSTVYQFPR